MGDPCTCACQDDATGPPGDPGPNGNVCQRSMMILEIALHQLKLQVVTHNPVTICHN